MIATWRDRLIMLSPLLGVTALVLITPSDDSPTFCPFALFTGTACPGCGMTRAASTLLKGDLGTAFSYHPLVLAIGVELAFGWAWFMLRRSGRVGPMSNRTLNVILAATAAGLVTAWIARAISGTLPPVATIS